jgi:S-adenosylmethionine uptake transporter
MPPHLSPIASAAPQAATQNNMRGVALMSLGFFLFAAGDVQSKLLTAELHPLQIANLRSYGLFLGVVVLLIMRGPGLLRSATPGLQIARGLTAAGSAVCFIVGIRYVPLADAVAVTFVAPFIVTVLGAVLLREPVGIRRWAAVAVGFVGMLIVIRPGTGVFHPAIFLILVAATMFSVRQILSRWLGASDSTETTVAYTALTVMAATLVAQPFVWETPDNLHTWLLILGVTVTAAMGEVLVILALRIAQSVVLAPLHYTLIIWGTLYGYLVFAELPDRWTLLGCAIIVASGLYTLHRERQRAR